VGDGGRVFEIGTEKRQTARFPTVPGQAPPKHRHATLPTKLKACLRRRTFSKGEKRHV